MAGCSTDEIPGIPGIGEKSATDFLWRVLPPGKKLDAIKSKEGEAIIYRNHDLIFLPHPATAPIAIEEPKYNPDALWRWAEKLGFRSFLDERRGAWEAFFRGELIDRMQTRKRK
jgi:5'-3' exonuclease